MSDSSLPLLLCSLVISASGASPETWERIFLEQDEAHWIALHQKLQRAAKVMTDAQFTQALERLELVQRYRDLWEKTKRTGETGEEQTS